VLVPGELSTIIGSLHVPQAEDIFCTNYRGGEGRTVLSWDRREAFNQSPLETMRDARASIICIPVPVGGLSLPDHKLQTNNPISLTGSLPTGLKEHLPSGDTEGHIGDYLQDGRTESITKELIEMWTKKRESMPTQVQRAKFEKRVPCPLYMKAVGGNASSGDNWSKTFATLWGFAGMNHPADYGTKQTFETSSSLINTMCFHT
jgi:hypothetical protein